MTQRNIDTMDIIVNQLAEGKSLSKALSYVYTKRNVAIPYMEDAPDEHILNLGLSTRTANALMRAHLKTIKEVIEYCSNNKVTKIQSIGVNSCTELLETILDFYWNKMDNDKRVSFLIDVVERNQNYIREEIA